MANPLSMVILLVLMVVVIVGVDVLSFASSVYTWDRLLLNVGIVLVFIAVYLRFFR